MEPLIKEFMGTTDTPTEVGELEVRFGKQRDKITKIKYDNVLGYLKGNGFRLTEKEITLKILLSKNVRCVVNGLESVVSYCKTNDLTKVLPENFAFVEKTLVRESHDNIEFDFRVSYQKEKLLEKTALDKLIKEWKSQKKRFRYVTRISLESEKFPGIRLDMSVVKSSSYSDKQGLMSSYTLEESNVFKNPETYEIEVELLKNVASFESNVKSMKQMIKMVQCGIQETNYPVAYSERCLIIINYRNLVEGTKPEKQLTAELEKKANQVKRPTNFIGPNSVTLQLENITNITDTNNVISITKDYSVTDKADGLRKMLFINDIGRIYLITTNMEIQFTGMVVKEKQLFSTLLDGEHIIVNNKQEFSNMFACFDIYFVNSNDTRGLPLFSADQDSRYTIMKRFVTQLNSDMENINNNSITKLNVSVKQFYSGKSIFELSAEVLQNAKKGIYNTDGLIFTPCSLSVGVNDVTEKVSNVRKTWIRSFKWKPPEFNTIDFMVTTKKTPTGGDLISSCMNDGVNASGLTNITEYKTVVLRCGFSQKYINPRLSMINNQVITGSPNEYKPAPFYPSNPSDNDTHICYIPLKSDGNGNKNMLSEEGEVFTDKTIVEFKYEISHKKHWRWVPIRVRHDKTAQLLSGERQYGNSYEVANKNWKSIHNPVTEEMISTGENIPYDIDESVYYNKKTQESTTRNMRNFHNLYVKTSLITKVANPDDTLIDYAVGKGGDISKWRKAKLGFVLGIDISEDNIENKQDGACVRYLENKQKYKDMFKAQFLVGNASANYLTGNGLVSDTDVNIYNAVIGRGPKDKSKLGEGVYNVYGKGASGFNISSIQFAMHYFFENKDTLMGVLRNVSENTKVGGYFVGTCFDGEKIFNLLEGYGNNETFAIKDNGNVLVEITKKYDKGEFTPDASSIGYAIEVFEESINKRFIEYLVNFKYLARVAENYGFVQLTRDECNTLGFPESIGSFRQLFIQMNQVKQDFGGAKNMSEHEKQLSFLNNYFIFKKVRDVDTKTVTLDIDDTGSLLEVEAASTVAEPKKSKKVTKKKK